MLAYTPAHQRSRALLSGRWEIDRGYGIQENPAWNRGGVENRRDIERHIPVAICPEQDVPNDSGRNGAAQVPPAIHRTGQGSGISTAHIHGGGPGRGHGQVIEKTSQGYGEYGRTGI